MSQFPIWTQWIQFTATVVIAIFATYIAYRQWRTAQERAMLDLFDRRMSIYEASRDVIGGIVREGSADDPVFFRFVQATDRLPMLFGNDVVAYSKATRERINKRNYHDKMAKALIDKPEQQPAYGKHVNASADLLIEISKFYDEFSALVAPYVRMNQRLSRF